MMKTNFSLVPKMVFSTPQLAGKMAYGFFTLKKSHLYKKLIKRDRLKDLSLLYLKVTPLCNLHCVMCGQYGDKGVMKGPAAGEAAKQILPLETYKKLIDEIASQKPIIYIWGGEPFLYPHLFELVAYIQKKGLACSINTNGTFLEQYAERIVRDKWNAIFVSLDGSQDVNDSMRGNGSYGRVVKGFAAINREKEKQQSVFPHMGVVSTVTNKNYLYIDRLAEASKDFRLSWHIYNLGTYTNDAIVAVQKQYMKEKLNTEVDCLEGYNTGYNTGIDGQKLYDLLTKIHAMKIGHPIITVPALNPEKINTYYAELDVPVRNHCIVPWSQGNINYNGDVHFCADYPDYILGNIKEQSLRSIYNGSRANIFRRALSSCKNGLFPGCIRCYQNMLFGKKVKGF